MSRKKIIILLFLIFLLWTCMIFYFSSQPSDVSNSQSGMAIRILKTVNGIFDITDTKLYIKVESVVKDIWFIDKYKTTNSVVRKSAHFGIYFLLGIISCSFGYLYSKKILMGFLLGISLPVLVAVLDEFNQGFVHRTSSLNDVIIDGAGALTGTFAILSLILIVKIIKYIKHYLLK